MQRLMLSSLGHLHTYEICSTAIRWRTQVHLSLCPAIVMWNCFSFRLFRVWVRQQKLSYFLKLYRSFLVLFLSVATEQTFTAKQVHKLHCQCWNTPETSSQQTPSHVKLMACMEWGSVLISLWLCCHHSLYQHPKKTLMSGLKLQNSPQVMFQPVRWMEFF